MFYVPIYLHLISVIVSIGYYLLDEIICDYTFHYNHYDDAIDSQS